MKKENKIVKINKFGMSLVGIIFFITILIVLEGSFNIVAAAEAAAQEMFYNPSSNIGYYTPGTYQSFSQKYAHIYWPSLATPEQCEASTDFLLVARPGGCTPAVVRSDLLEEQNVPVFCKVDIIKLNPLVDISKLKSVRFSGEYGKYVAGVSFHPYQEAIYSHQVALDNPLINDVGYVVVVLKRIPREQDMPDSVKINLTGVLKYDAEGFFGAGKNNFYLQVIDDENWSKGDLYKENSFFKGRGYLRAEWIEEDKAKISIYRDKDTKLTSFTLEEGETSGLYYMPGFYCRAGVKVRFQEISTGVKRVQLEVDDNRIWLVEGERFLDEKCQVSRVNVDEEKGERSVKISCRGQKTETLSYKEAKGNCTELGGTWKPKCTENEQDKTSEAADASEKENANKKCCVPKEKSKVTDKEVDDTVKIYFEKTKEYAEDLDAFYGAVEDPFSQEVWSAKALYLLGVLADNIGLDATALEMFQKVINEYPETAFANSAKLKLEHIDSDAVSFKGTKIKLISIDVPGKQEASADFTIKKVAGEGRGTDSYLQVQEKKVFDKDEKFELLKIEKDRVQLEYRNDTKDTGKFYLKLHDTARKGDYYITLDEITIEKFAKVQVISEIKQYAEAPFVVEIGIEKRAIKLSPETARDLIKNLNESIKQWEELIDRLGKMVKAWKGACFATSAILIVKNFFSNLGGGATARQAVMPEWYKQCERLVGKDKVAFNKCLKDKSDVIEKDVQTYQQQLEKLNKEIIDLQNQNLQPGTDVVNRNAVLEQFRNKYASSMAGTYEYQIYNAETGEYETKTITITPDNLGKEKSLTRLRDLRLYQMVRDAGGSEVLQRSAGYKIEGIAEKISTSQVDKGLYSQGSLEWVNSVQAAFFMSGKSEGLVNRAPIPKVYTKRGAQGKILEQEPAQQGTKIRDENGDIWIRQTKGWVREGDEKTATWNDIKGNDPRLLSNEDKVTGFYVVVSDASVQVEGLKISKTGGYTDAADIKEFWIQNIGNDSVLDTSDDQKHLVIMEHYDQYLAGRIEILGLDGKESKKLVQDAINVIKEANLNYGKNKFNLLNYPVTVDLSKRLGEMRCQDFMSPQDCWILFNVCDPVICPASRCDLGGAYRVDDVIQSGVIGSIALCLPNFAEGIIVPVCLSGIHAGLEAYLSILKSYRDCLQENLDSGKTVGICDEIHSIYLCEFFWRQIGPFLDILIMRMFEVAYGQGMKGGGEYLTVQDAWQHAAASINYLKNDYALNSYKAFQARSWQDAGTEFCKLFISAKYPTKLLDNLLEPDSPTQFYAWFDEIPFTEATLPSTSQYKVYYHIWAGRDIGASYQIYLKDPTPSAYVHVQETILVDTGYVPTGGYASETRDFTAPAGYKQLCVRINGQDECGFKKVSTDFAIDYLSDLYYLEQLNRTDIRTTEQCTGGSPSAYSLLNPNVQEGVAGYISPSLEKQGVVRVCSSTNPGQNTNPERWEITGYCDTEDVKCWLDKQSVSAVIKNKNIASDVLQGVKNISAVEQEIYDDTKANEILEEAKKTIEDLRSHLNLLSTTTTDAQTRKQNIINILNTEKDGVALSWIDISSLFKQLEQVEQSSGYNVTQNKKAEAAYYKFYIYYLLTDALQNAQTELPVDISETDIGAAQTTTTITQPATQPTETESKKTEETKGIIKSSGKTPVFDEEGNLKIDFGGEIGSYALSGGKINGKDVEKNNLYWWNDKKFEWASVEEKIPEDSWKTQLKQELNEYKSKITSGEGIIDKVVDVIDFNNENYVTKEGDTLKSIATEICSSEDNWKEIYLANKNKKEITQSSMLPKGIVLKIPDSCK